MSNNRILGNLASYIDSSSNGGAITKSGNDFFIQAMTDSDVGGSPATGIAGTDSASVKGLITTSRVVQKSGRSKNAPGLKNVLQGEITKLNPSASATYNLGDSSNPIDEIILDSSATIFFGDISLTSMLKSGTSSIAVAAIPVPPSNSSYTSLLLKTDSTQTDAQVDASTNAATITENGNVTSTAFTPHHPGGYSTYFDGTGDYLTTSDASNAVGSGDFTVEAWVYVTSLSSDRMIASSRVASSNSTLYWSFYANSDGRALFITRDSGGTQYIAQTATGTIEINKWYHIAGVRESGVNKVYVNGTVGGTTANDGGLNLTEATIGVGFFNYPGYVTYMLGYISDFRLVKGTAVYTSAFTSPTERLTAITGTELLTCHLPYIADGSTNGHAITIYGNTSTKRFGPYDYFSYSPSSYGGSVYFDGSGDYLSMPSSEGYKFGTGDFTIEGWMYFDTISTSVGQTVIDSWQGTNNYNWLVNFDADTFTFVAGNNGAYSAGNTHNITTSLSAGNWYHFAVTRESSSLRCFINGVQQGSTLSNTANISDNIPVYIGTNQDGGGTPFSGHLSDIRIVKGTALYTADFTPPTEPLTAIAGTELLTCTNKNSIYDVGSGNSLTVVGNATTDTNTTKYSSSSMYFDGTGDYVTAQMDNLIISESEDWTVEFWAYTVNITTDNSFITFGPTDSGTGSGKVGFGIYESGTKLAIIDFSQSNSNKSIFGNASQLTANTWHHLAFVKSGSQVALFIDGTIDSAGWATLASNITLSNRERAHIGGVYNIVHNGYLEDVRITKGVARYTANFTPPTAALEG